MRTEHMEKLMEVIERASNKRRDNTVEELYTRKGVNDIKKMLTF